MIEFLCVSGPTTPGDLWFLEKRALKNEWRLSFFNTLLHEPQSALKFENVTKNRYTVCPE